MNEISEQDLRQVSGGSAGSDGLAKEMWAQYQREYCDRCAREDRAAYHCQDKMYNTIRNYASLPPPKMTYDRKCPLMK